MIMMKKYIVVLIGLVSMFSCKSTKEAVTEEVKTKITEAGIVEDKGALLISYSRGTCYGRCPVYTIDVFEKSVMEFNGHSFTDKEGLWQKTMTAAQMAKVTAALETADFATLDTEYKSMIPDLPRATFEYHGGEESKTVTGKETLPEQIKPLQELLESFTELSGWTKVADTGKDEKAELNYDEIIVKFKPGTGLPGWFRAKQEIGIYLKRRVAPESDLWVAGYKRATHKPEEILKIIKEDPGIESAEFNKQTKNR